jgi:hypothetical protein
MDKSVDLKVRRWEMYKFAVRWVLAAGTCGALGIWVLNTLAALSLPTPLSIGLHRLQACS